MSKRWKAGRNQPCICGSGKKYKKCCGQYEFLAGVLAKNVGLRVVREKKGQRFWSVDRDWLKRVQEHIHKITRGLENENETADLVAASDLYIEASAMHHVAHREDVQDALEASGWLDDAQDEAYFERMRFRVRIAIASLYGVADPDVFLPAAQTSEALLYLGGYLS